MVRENQGLQIALVVFVMLTLVLGVAALVFHSRYQEAAVSCEQAAKRRQQEESALRQQLEDAIELKQMMGLPSNEGMTGIRENYEWDMAAYGASLPESECNYRGVIRHLHRALEQQHADLSALQMENLDWKIQYERREQSKDSQVERYKQAASDAQVDLRSQQQAAAEERERMTAEKDDLQLTWAAARGRFDQRLGRAAQEIETLQAENRDSLQYVRWLKGQLDRRSPDPFDVADGNVRWVDQRLRTVWIDLGREDGLPSQLEFDVLAADGDRTGEALVKGRITVTRVLGDHLAQARITDDRVTDPIVPGDAIDSEVWSPGDRVHVAVAAYSGGGQEGRRSLRQVLGALAVRGWVVDAYIDESGEGVGRVTAKTRYLLVGPAPDATAPPGASRAYSQLVREAERLNIEQVQLERVRPRLRRPESGTPAPQRSRFSPTGGIM